MIVFNQVLVAGWELTWVLSALLSNNLLAAQKTRLQLQFQQHPFCIKEEDRISQQVIFYQFYRYVGREKENPQQHT